MNLPRTVAWLLVGAGLAAVLDVLQIRLAVGPVGFPRLALLVGLVYLALGLGAGLLLASIAGASRHRFPSHVQIVVLSIIGWPALVAWVYLNVVHLPAPSEPVTIVVNLAFVLALALACGISAALPGSGKLFDRGPLAALIVLPLCAAGLFLLARPGGASHSSTPRPSALRGASDVYVIVIDTLRFDASGLDQHAAARLPNLARLARHAASYQRSYAQASWTKPSVASLWTSLYPSSHRANLRRDRLSGQAVTLPEVFSQAGYRTAVFSANPWISPAFGFDQGVGEFFEAERESYVRFALVLRLLKQVDRRLPARGAIAAGLRFLEQQTGVRGSKRSNCARDDVLVERFDTWLQNAGVQPLFAYLHLMSPHIPYLPPGREREIPEAEQVALLHRHSDLEPQRRSLLLELYDATVRHADQVLGQLLDSLEQAGRYDNALIVVTADHGEEFFEHGRWGHGKSLYDEVIRVPLLIKYPGRQSGLSVSSPAMLVDVLPTLAASLELPAVGQWEGRNLNAPDKVDRPCFAELIREGGLDQAMVFERHRKYIESTPSLGGQGQQSLYDLEADPREQNPATGPQVGAWQEQLQSMRGRAFSKRLGASRTQIDAAARERLEALGYAN